MRAGGRQSVSGSDASCISRCLTVAGKVHVAGGITVQSARGEHTAAAPAQSRTTASSLTSRLHHTAMQKFANRGLAREKRVLE
jgi:hypothetical protein